jgi:hypothetical protein
MIKMIYALIIIALLSSCADSTEILRENKSTNLHLNNSDSILISIPSDGIYGDKTYTGSGQNTSQIIYASLSRHSHNIQIGNLYESFSYALDAAKRHGAKYLVYPTILYWEDRATEWSGIPDKIEVRIEIVEISTGSTVSSALIKGKSGLATLGGDHPQDLLPKPIDEFIDSLY